MKSLFLPGLLFLFLVPLGSCLAEQSGAQADFREGVVAFQAGQLKKARSHLEQARHAGLSSSSLFYNLGVVYFRLDQYQQAEAAFSELLGTPHAPLARYNLGLVLKARGDLAGAREWFVSAAEASSPPQIRALAEQQLAAAEGAARLESGTGTAAAPNPNIGFVSLAAGYDDNIASTPSAAITNEAGGFTELLASARSAVYQDRGRAMRLNTTAYTRHYPGNSEYDNTYASAGVAWQQPLELARLTSELSLVGLWFDTDLLERQVRLDVGYQRPGCFWPQFLVVACEIQGFAATIQGGSGFEVYDGSLFGGVVTVEKAVGPWALNASYRLDIDRREDLESGSEFFSLSPTRHRVSMAAERRITERFNMGASQSLRVSRYDDPHRLFQDGQLETTTREDNKYRAQIFAGYDLSASWRLGVELGWETNQSTISRYEYDRTELLVSIDGVF